MEKMKPTRIEGSDQSILALMPRIDEIPAAFKKFPPANKWSEIINEWVYRGLSRNAEFYAKEGIDGELALSHIKAIFQSFEPSHQHKTAACSYLLALWFDDVVNYKNDYCEGGPDHEKIQPGR